VNAVVKNFTGASQWYEQRCMALVSLETEGEWNEVRRRMESWKAPVIWTSGHICDKRVKRQWGRLASLLNLSSHDLSMHGSGAALAFAWDQLIGHKKDGDQTPGGQMVSVAELARLVRTTLPLGTRG